MIYTELNQRQTTEQKQILTPAMRQQLEVLSMDELCLMEKINKALEENPFLERCEESFNNFSEIIIKPQDNSFIAEAVHGESLKESLKKQLYGIELTEIKEKICLFMIESIDEKGYLKINPDLHKVIGTKEEEIEECAKIVRRLEPIGVCAENLSQCLIVQLKALNKLNSVTEFMITDGIELLAGRKYDKISKLAKCSIKEVESYAKVIKNLNPIPSRGFDNGENIKYIIPDALVKVIDDKIKIIMNESQKVRFTREYSKIKNLNDELKNKKSEAKKLEKAVADRYLTVENIIEKICHRQIEYFTGNGELKPLLLKDIAEETKLNISTVSRGIKDKYIMYDGKIMPLKAMFSQKAPGCTDISVKSVKTEISRIISNENKGKPFSDEKISFILSEYGVKISRRTVAKYREETGIKNAYERLEKYRKDQRELEEKSV